MRVLDEETLKSYEEASHQLHFDDSFNEIGKLNLACWLGQRAHFMLETIRSLEKEVDRLEGENLMLQDEVEDLEDRLSDV